MTDDRGYLSDIRECIDRIEAYTESAGLERVIRERLLQIKIYGRKGCRRAVSDR